MTVYIWLNELFKRILIKYSKSGVKLPITNPKRENHRFGIYVKGKMAAGWEKVKYKSCFRIISALP